MRVTNSARSASAWPKCESVAGHGLQKDASTALRTPASRSLTATASKRDMMNSSVPADQSPLPVEYAWTSCACPFAFAAAAAACEIRSDRTSKRRQHVNAASRRVAGSSSSRYSTTFRRTNPNKTAAPKGNVPSVLNANCTRAL